MNSWRGGARGARALATALLAACVACSEADRTPAEGPPNVLLLCVDTLRADHLGAWGHDLDTSPTVDRLAASGVRFDDASVQWTKTWPSMASMLTGTYPTRTGVRYEPRRPLPERNVTLAEVFRDAGYRTAAVVANANLSRDLGFDQGFDHFVESWMEAYRRRHGDAEFENRPGLTKRLTDARQVVDEGLDWLDASSAATPFFLWLHFIDPHGPYVPPRRHERRFRAHYAPQPVPERLIPRYQRHERGGSVVDDLGFYKARYDAEIRHFDDELARLLAELERRGLDRNTVVAFTADHGESLDEHRYLLSHGALPYQPTAHVPLVLVWPGRLPAGRVVREPVGLVDLAPTLLELAGVGVPEGVQGRSLVPRIEGSGSAGPGYVFLEAGVHRPSQRAVRKGPWKLVHFRAEADRERLRRPEWVLHHLDRDPEELRNLADQYPELVAELRSALERYDATRLHAQSDDDTLRLDALDPRTRDQLRALGYVDEPADADEAPERSPSAESDPTLR